MNQSTCILTAALLASLTMATAQNGPQSYSIATPRPINPAESTTNPSAQATQAQNPYLGSVPAKATGAVLELSLAGAIDRGLRYNLGLVESEREALMFTASAFALWPRCCRKFQRTAHRVSIMSVSPRSA